MNGFKRISECGFELSGTLYNVARNDLGLSGKLYEAVNDELANRRLAYENQQYEEQQEQEEQY